MSHSVAHTHTPHPTSRIAPGQHEPQAPNPTVDDAASDQQVGAHDNHKHGHCARQLGQPYMIWRGCEGVGRRDCTAARGGIQTGSAAGRHALTPMPSLSVQGASQCWPAAPAPSQTQHHTHARSSCLCCGSHRTARPSCGRPGGQASSCSRQPTSQPAASIPRPAAARTRCGPWLPPPPQGLAPAPAGCCSPPPCRLPGRRALSRGGCRMLYGTL